MLGQPFRRNYPSIRHQEQREHRTPFRAAKREFLPVPDRLHRPEDAELERLASRSRGRQPITSHAYIVSQPGPPRQQGHPAWSASTSR